MIAIAVLIACHNRCQTTISCLEALYLNALPAGFRLEVFLVDDGSTDGTAEAVAAQYTRVHVLRGNGSLYWNGAMRLAFATAVACKQCELFLWLNDDTLLSSDAILRAVEWRCRILREIDRATGIIVGATTDPDSGVLTYGGLRRKGSGLTSRLVPIPISEVPQPCDTMNGNFVLIDRETVQKVGVLSPQFVHALGDWDYGLRTSRAGVAIWQVPGSVGQCRRNGVRRPKSDPLTALREVASVKGLPPRAWFTYLIRHHTLLFPLLFPSPYLKAFVGAMFGKIRNALHKARSL